MKRLFVDTSAWFAFLNRDDPDHERVAQVLLEWEGRLLTTDYVFDELVTLIRRRVDHASACGAGEALRDPMLTDLSSVIQADLREAWHQFTREKDKSYSFTDCTSFAVMRRLRMETAAAADADFRRAGFMVLPE